MKKFKPFIASSLIALTVISVPYASFADNDKEKNGRGHNEIEKSIKLSDKEGKKSNSFWNRFGIFGGHANSNASVSVSIDAPSISGITSPTVLGVGQMGTWSVNASDPKNGQLSYAVNWGDNEDNSTMKMAVPQAFVQTSTFTHSYANKGVYNVRFTVSNDAGLKTTSTVNVKVGGESLSAPVISNLAVESKRPRKAMISWVTDVRASSFVWYSKTSPVDTSTNPKIVRQSRSRVLKHRINLTKLEPNTKYYVIVGSANNGGKTLSSEISFTTPVVEQEKAPVITSLTGPTTIVAGNTEKVTVNAYDPKNSSLSYSVDWGDTALPVMSQSIMKPLVFVQSTTFEHIYNTPGTYTAKFTVENSSGLKTSSSMNITVTASTSDTTAPVISNVGVSGISTSTSTITWKTDEPATSKVFYSTGTPVDIDSASAVFVSNDSLVTDHSVNITGLTTNTLYHFVVVSIDSSNNKTKSSESMFATL